MKLPAIGLTQHSAFTIDRDLVVDEDALTAELCFSSELAFERDWGIEVLDHDPAAVDMTRLQDGAPLLVNHDMDQLCGVVERASIDSDRRGRATVRFSDVGLGPQMFREVATGVRRNVSVGYLVQQREEQSQPGAKPIVKVTRWLPYEISIVAVPADHTVGIGRSLEDEEIEAVEPTDEIAPEPQAEKDAAPGGTQPDDEERAASTLPSAEVKTLMTDTNEALRVDRERQIEIRALGARVGVDQNLIDTACSEGRSIDDFVKEVNSKLPETRAIRTADDPSIGMSQEDVENFSFVRALAAQAHPHEQSIQRAAAFEIECSAAARAKLQNEGEHRGIMVPIDVLRGERRDLNVGTPTAGGNLVPVDYLNGSFIGLLRNSMACSALGVRFLAGLNGNVAIPRQTGGAVGYWVGEGSSATASQASFDQVSLTPKSASINTAYTRKMLLQASPDVEAMVREDLILRMAETIENVIINGSGTSPEPRGILNLSGLAKVFAGGAPLNTTNANGAALIWDDIVNLETAVATANAAIGSQGYLVNTKGRGKMKRTQKFTGTNGDPIWERDNSLNGYPVGVTNLVPSNGTKNAGTNLSSVIFGNFADVIVGMWGGLDLTVDGITNAHTGSVRVIAFQDVDVAVRHVESFAAMTDAITI